MRNFITIILLIAFTSCQKDDMQVKGFYEDGPRLDSSGKAIYAIFIPNSFTPNGDGINEQFGPKGYGIDINYKLEIFSQENQLIFFSTNPDRLWDGRANHAGIIAPSGQYPYKISFTDIDGVNRAGSGTVVMTK